MIIRREADQDRDAIRTVHATAFLPADGGIAAEARLVDALGDGGTVPPALSLVAELDSEIVGHVVCSRGDIDGHPALGLGPLGVRPEHQRRGIGQALMHSVLAAADALEEPCVVLLGDARYYSRFGFEMAEPRGVRPPDPTWAEHFQIRRLTAWTDALHGTFRYAAAFDGL